MEQEIVDKGKEYDYSSARACARQRRSLIELAFV